MKRDETAAAIPALADRLRAACAPMDRTRLRQRLTMLGSAMAPNRTTADAAAWLNHMTAGLADLPEDLILEALDEWVKRSKYPPSVAELREMIEPCMRSRSRDMARVEAIEALIASGADIPPAPPLAPPPEPEPAWDERDRCTAEQAAAILADEFPQLRTETRALLTVHRGPPRKPTRADYIALGVDPALLDGELV